MSLWVNLAGIAIIAAIIWWFWLSKPKAKRVQSGVLEILVDNGVYTPARVEIQAREDVTLRFIRKDASPCAEKVIFADLGINTDLPLNKPVDIQLDKLTAGEYEFTCQMQMYRGSLVVR